VFLQKGVQEQENNQEGKGLDEINVFFDKVIVSALVVVCFFILQIFVTATPDIAIYIALGSVAIAIPLLVGYFIMVALHEKGILKVEGWVPAEIIERIGMAGTVVAVDAAFWHVHWLIGVAFLTSALVTIIIFSTYTSRNSNFLFSLFRL